MGITIPADVSPVTEDDIIAASSQLSQKEMDGLFIGWQDKFVRPEDKKQVILSWLKAKSDQCGKEINLARYQEGRYELKRLRTIQEFIKTAYMHEHTQEGKE